MNKLSEYILAFEELFPNVLIKTVAIGDLIVCINEQEPLIYEIASSGKVSVSKNPFHVKFEEIMSEMPKPFPAGVLSLDKKPKGKFKLVIKEEDYDKAEDGYWNDDCPLGQAVKRSFPNIGKFKTYEDGIGNNRDKNIANIYPAFKESDYKSFNKEFKTTITFL